MVTVTTATANTSTTEQPQACGLTGCDCHLVGPAASQARFEAMFDHTPMVDTRTPAQVRDSR